MRKLLAVALVGTVCFVAGRLWQQSQVNAEAAGSGGNTPPPCQDINGDGASDISDAVYFLQWQFLGGPAPECPPAYVQPVGLLDTGPTLCYNSGGVEIPCDSTTCAGQDGHYATGCSMDDRFVDNGDGTVTDTCTGLVWQQDTADVTGDQQIGGNDRLQWCEALQYCETLVLTDQGKWRRDGDSLDEGEEVRYDDWRLPNVRELQSIVDYGRDHPAIDPVFESTMSWYWSSSTLVTTPSDAWSVCFGYGGAVLEFGKTGTYYVRAVHTIQPSE